MAMKMKCHARIRPEKNLESRIKAYHIEGAICSAPIDEAALCISALRKERTSRQRLSSRIASVHLSCGISRDQGGVT